MILFQSDRNACGHVYFASRANRSDNFGAPAIARVFNQYMSTLSDPFVAPDGCTVCLAATLASGTGLADLYVVEAPP